jgi:hypothetical protein
MATKQQWGSITWIFLHTIAEKIVEERFPSHIERLTRILNGLCQVLPCPSCSTHCSSFLRATRPQRIPDKGGFIRFLNRFHNVVNARLGKPMVSLEECTDKYARAKTVAVVNAFYRVFSMRDAAPNLMLNNMHKVRFLNQLRHDIQAMKADMRA